MRRPNKKRLMDIRGLIKNPRYLDMGKNILIALLIVSAALLAVKSGLFSLAGGKTEPGQTMQQGQQQTGIAGGAGLRAAGPYVIAITDASGSRCGLMYDGAELTQAYESFSAYLGEAMGSAGEPEEISKKAWQSALTGTGVYFDFGYSLPVNLLASTLGASVSGGAGNHMASRFCLAVEKDDSVSIYYYRDKDSKYYKCSTAVNSSAMETKLKSWSPNGAAFLFESGSGRDYDLVDDCFLVVPGQAQIHAVTAVNPLGMGYDVSTLMDIFGMNSYLVQNYSDADNTQVYVEGDNTLRVGADGIVTFKSSDETAETGGGGDLSGALSKAMAAVSGTIGAVSGIASADICAVGYNESAGAFTVRFSYEIGGLPVSLGDESAAEFSISGGRIVAARLNFREYAYSGDDDAPMPSLQAMAVVQAKGGGMPVLGYVDYGGSVSAGWMIIK